VLLENGHPHILQHRCLQRHTSQPKTTPKPPRKRWYEYPKRRPPQAIARAWSEPILGVVDRTGRATFQHMQNTLQPTIDTTLVPQVAPDVIVLFDGAPQYEAIAKARGLSFKVLVGGRRTKRMPKAYHLNSVNSLHSEWKRDFRGRWRGTGDKLSRWLRALDGGAEMGRPGGVVSPDHHGQLS